MKTKKLWDALVKKKRIVYLLILIILILFFVWPHSFPELTSEVMPSMVIVVSGFGVCEECYPQFCFKSMVVNRDSEEAELIHELLSGYTFRRSPILLIGNVYRALYRFFTNTSGVTHYAPERYRVELLCGVNNIVFSGDGRVLINNSFHRMNRRADNEVINEILAILGYYSR